MYEISHLLGSIISNFLLEYVVFLVKYDIYVYILMAVSRSIPYSKTITRHLAKARTLAKAWHAMAGHGMPWQGMPCPNMAWHAMRWGGDDF